MAEISSKRFGESSKQEIQKIIEQRKPKNTKNNRCVWNQFQQFCNERGYEFTKETPTQKIATILADWAVNMRRSNGEEYKEYTVKTMWNVTAKLIQEKYFTEYQRNFNPFYDQEFKHARDARKAKRKLLQTIPEKRKVSSKALKSEQYQLMIDSCNENTPEGLLLKFFLIASLELGWRGSDGSNCLLYYFQEDVNNDGITSPLRIAYNPEFSRTSQGGDLMLPGTKWLTENKEITSKCPVRLFNLLLKKRTQKIKTDYFFITPNVSYQKTGEWYKDIPLQRNELLNWTKTYAKKTQLKTNSRRITINSVCSLAQEQKLINPISYQKTGERYNDLSLHRIDLSNLTKTCAKRAPCAMKAQVETYSQRIIVNSGHSLLKKQEPIKITRSMRPILPKPYVVINQQCNSTVVSELSGKQLSPIGQSEMGTLACPLCCDNKFSSRLSLKHHLLEIESKIQCPDCCERFHSILELANHLDGQCWKPTEVIEIKNEVLDTKEFSEGDYKSEDGQIAGNIADDSNSCLQEVESVISGLTEESTSQMAIDPLENMDVMIKSEVDSDSEDSLSFKAEMDVENVEECKIDEPSSHQQFEGFIIQQTADTQRIAEGNSADCKLPKNVLHVTKKRYRQVYDQFCSWRNLNHIDHVTEDVMLSYMYYLSKTLKCCSSLWSKYSMIKSMLLVHENLNISHYNNVKSFLKKQSTGYRPTQSKTLSRDEVNRFMSEASDEEHLLTKVVAMIGIAAGCRREELYGMLLGDVEDTGSVLFITIAGKPNHMRREFIIANDIQGLNFLELFRKYVSLRPKNCDHDFLFVGYRKGRCISQRVGIHTIGGVPKKIASFLGLANPETYTAHCFRLSSSVIRARTY